MGAFGRPLSPKRSRTAAMAAVYDLRERPRSLKSYTAAIAAVRDLFGDNGRPNAPMRELIAGLEALTAGAVGQIDPGRLNGLVRNTYNLAKQTGIPLNNLMMMQQHGAM